MEGIPEIFYERAPQKTKYILQWPSRNGKLFGGLLNTEVPSEYYTWKTIQGICNI